MIVGQMKMQHDTTRLKKRITNVIDRLVEENLLGLVVIDEAHCVPLQSEHFRTEFADLRANVMDKIKRGSFKIPVLYL